MEIDDLKNTWQNKNNTAGQEYLTDLIIDKMTEKKYKSKIKKISYPEIIGCIVCVITAIFIVINIGRLETFLLRAIGILSSVTLITISVFSVVSLTRLSMKKDFNKTYADTLKIFATEKIAFYKLQKINILLCYLLMVTIIILLPKFFGDKDITQYKYFWLFAFGTGYSFLFLFSKFVLKFYKKILKQSEELLLELPAN